MSCPVYDCLHKGGNMRRTELLQEVGKMRFKEVLGIWTERNITQEEAALMPGVSDRTFRRYVEFPQKVIRTGNTKGL